MGRPFCCNQYANETLGVTPAMEVGITDKLRDMEWLVGLIDAREPKRPKTYRKTG